MWWGRGLLECCRRDCKFWLKRGCLSHSAASEGSELYGPWYLQCICSWRSPGSISYHSWPFLGIGTSTASTQSLGTHLSLHTRSSNTQKKPSSWFASQYPMQNFHLANCRWYLSHVWPQRSLSGTLWHTLIKLIDSECASSISDVHSCSWVLHSSPSTSLITALEQASPPTLYVPPYHLPSVTTLQCFFCLTQQPGIFLASHDITCCTCMIH